jgi:hypothetical protein
MLDYFEPSGQQVQIDARLVLDAAQRAVTLWPDDEARD